MLDVTDQAWLPQAQPSLWTLPSPAYLQCQDGTLNRDWVTDLDGTGKCGLGLQMKSRGV
jgi:hypothetical protein